MFGCNPCTRRKAVINLFIFSFYSDKAGLTLKALKWENAKIGADDYIEDFYVSGREEELLDPNHFQGLFLLMGILISIGLGKLS